MSILTNDPDRVSGGTAPYDAGHSIGGASRTFVDKFIEAGSLVDTPLFTAAATTAGALILGPGSICLAVAWLRGAGRPARSTRICRCVGILLFGVGVFCRLTPPRTEWRAGRPCSASA